MRFLIYLFLLCLTPLYASSNIADTILTHYQQNFDKLPLEKQEHFALRAYRISSHQTYLPTIIKYLHALHYEYQNLLSILHSPKKIRDETQKMLESKILFSILHSPREGINKNILERKKNRVKKLTQYGNLLFYINTLIITQKIYSYHLENTLLFPRTDEFVKEIRKQLPQLEKFILDKDNIKIFGSQLINYVYFLYDLKLIDLRKPYTQLFQQTFPDSLDKKLKPLEYEGKIYGLTHFITAASRYYQYYVNDEEFRWISNYFEKNIQEILKRSENDVILEIGVCLMLLNKQDSPTVKTIKDYLITQYNPHYKMFPTRTHSFNFVFGEHRNILAIMFFNWPHLLTPGPFFNEKLELISN
ncbi:MAG: DUF3541 domain-containing protein [Proteobacteria bacterium]|nr:DUF3541 domain-containing protein [Pseudomonadota bacterium]